MAFADKKRANAYNESYKSEHYTRLNIMFRKGHKELVRVAAEAAGESMNAYIKGAIAARLEEDGLVVPEDF